MVICINVARMGYYSGDPEKVRNARVDDVFNILDYEKFKDLYELTLIKINE